MRWRVPSQTLNSRISNLSFVRSHVCLHFDRLVFADQLIVTVHVPSREDRNPLNCYNYRIDTVWFTHKNTPFLTVDALIVRKISISAARSIYRSQCLIVIHVCQIKKN